MAKMNSPIHISFRNLAVISGEGESLPLSALNHDCHIHGELEFKIGNKRVPYMGFGGPEDVCFSDWITQLDTVVHFFNRNDHFSYLYDEGEQGQPAYLFKRQKEKCFLSIINSKYEHGGTGHPQWQQIEFGYRDFLNRYREFREKFFKELQAAALTGLVNKWVETFICSPLGFNIDK
jgi:hypothetical protein